MELRAEPTTYDLSEVITVADTLTVTARSAQRSHAPVSADDFPALPLTLALPHCPQSVAGARR
ncbi:hypothetical protein AB0P44_46010, partial [Streptomyces chartreusis]|uniref:hypothetical protein n=1 Tax=Streptomyces chartreusis TaxID=1969 RepID=UPI00341B56F1